MKPLIAQRPRAGQKGFELPFKTDTRNFVRRAVIDSHMNLTGMFTFTEPCMHTLHANTELVVPPKFW
jgi:hypothetical protein